MEVLDEVMNCCNSNYRASVWNPEYQFVRKVTEGLVARRCIMSLGEFDSRMFI